MPTWRELKDYARTKYALDDDAEDDFSLIFEFETGRTQKIGVTRFSAFGKDWIELRSYVCKGTQLAMDVALRKNEEMAIGALALDAHTIQLVGAACTAYKAPVTAPEITATFACGATKP